MSIWYLFSSSNVSFQKNYCNWKISNQIIPLRKFPLYFDYYSKVYSLKFLDNQESFGPCLAYSLKRIFIFRFFLLNFRDSAYAYIVVLFEVSVGIVRIFLYQHFFYLILPYLTSVLLEFCLNWKRKRWEYLLPD